MKNDIYDGIRLTLPDDRWRGGMDQIHQHDLLVPDDHDQNEGPGLGERGKRQHKVKGASIHLSSKKWLGKDSLIYLDDLA